MSTQMQVQSLRESQKTGGLERRICGEKAGGRDVAGILGREDLY